MILTIWLIEKRLLLLIGRVLNVPSTTSTDERSVSSVELADRKAMNLRRRDTPLLALNRLTVSNLSDYSNTTFLALLVRELPASSTEYDIMQSFSTYSNIPIQRVHIASSKKYCLVQLRSIEDASYLLSTFNRVPPYIQNCAVIVTFSRTSLNKVLLQESVNAIKSQSGISSDQLQAGKTLILWSKNLHFDFRSDQFSRSACCKCNSNGTIRTGGRSARKAINFNTSGLLSALS
jgi:hypothetical protein